MLLVLTLAIANSGDELGRVWDKGELRASTRMLNFGHDIVLRIVLFLSGTNTNICKTRLVWFSKAINS